ncbi:ATP-binding protein [Candidatus Entotheonella palauensis]|uniref:ATP-binding protein n=1 Tax=Candidatus Entotheonella palauensis TaxID=93172 RepID=UPI000B7FE89A|nr:ATP-binding protein [Candidatus Entotheonella palauensis]
METRLSQLVHTFLETFARALFVLSPDGQFVDANETADQRLGHTRTDLLTMRLSEVEERFELEAQLRQARKMEALGSLAGGVTHEFNNILTSIFGYAEMARLELPPDSSQAMHLDQVLIAAARAKELVRKILAFSRQQATPREPTSMHQVVHETLGLLRATFPATVDLQVHVPDDAGSVMADRVQLQEVVMNLCTNAEYAMRQSGGQLWVSLAATEVDHEFAAAHPPLEAGPYVCLTVKDTGPGITPDIMERIYDPFFTTKSAGEGTGMGLAIVHGIVTDHGGAISVFSSPGEGSTFQVYLPQVRTPEALNPPLETSIPYGEGRILVVDDEPIQTELLKLQLNYLGYDVQSATHSHEALLQFQANPGNFDLVITDQTMPEITGEQLIQAVRKIRPELPVILLTGFSHLIDKDKARALGINAFLMKPITIEALATTVHQVLEHHDE